MGFEHVAKRLTSFPRWAVLLLAIAGPMVLSMLLWRDSFFSWASAPAPLRAEPGELRSDSPSIAPRSELGPRHQLTYQQWVALLSQEAKVAAEQHPARLNVLAGDSLSLWFPSKLLPPEMTWLNQGISGDTSSRLLKRLHLFDDTAPERVFVLIGINDLLRGTDDEALLKNQRQIVQYLKLSHPQTEIVVQSILPHAGDRLIRQRPDYDPPAWAVRLAAISNQRIQTLNRELAAIAKQERVEFLDLYPHFADSAGNLLPDLTTDGLHLSAQGYQVWRTQLDAFRADRPH